MAHFAKIQNGKVTKVIVAEPEFFNTFVDDSPGQWLQTSYNTRGGIHYDPETGEPDGGVALRMNFAGIGYDYNAALDAFIPQKPYDSWVLNEETCLWEPPTPYPDDGEMYQWDESTTSWQPQEI